MKNTDLHLSLTRAHEKSSSSSEKVPDKGSPISIGRRSRNMEFSRESLSRQRGSKVRAIVISPRQKRKASETQGLRHEKNKNKKQRKINNRKQKKDKISVNEKNQNKRKNCKRTPNMTLPRQ
jgi:hypothetical protein